MVLATSLALQHLALTAEAVGPADAPRVPPSTGSNVFLRALQRRRSDPSGQFARFYPWSDIIFLCATNTMRLRTPKRSVSIKSTRLLITAVPGSRSAPSILSEMGLMRAVITYVQ